MSEFVKIAGNGQWALNKSAEDPYGDGGTNLHDSKGHCRNCGNKACDGADCKVDHAGQAVQANNEKNKGFTNKIKIAGNGQWKLNKN